MLNFWLELLSFAVLDMAPLDISLSPSECLQFHLYPFSLIVIGYICSNYLKNGNFFQTGHCGMCWSYRGTEKPRETTQGWKL